MGEEHQRLKALLAEVWTRRKTIVFDRVLILEEAAAALKSGSLEVERREQAASEAHRLAGALGTLGFPKGSRISSMIEVLLESERILDHEDGKHLTSLVKRLREELSDEAAGFEEGI